MSKQFSQHIWNKYFADATVVGPPRVLDSSQLRFDCKWLDGPSTYVEKLWCSLHLSLAKSPDTYNKFDVMFWLSTIAFAEKADMDIVQALAALYRLPQLCLADIPQQPRFELQNGFSVIQNEVRAIVQQASRSFQACPEFNYPRMEGEDTREYQRRRKEQFESHQNNAISVFARAIRDQWPCEKPQKPSNQTTDVYVDTSSAMREVLPKFETWYDNLCFHQYLQKLGSSLRRQRAIAVTIPCYAFSVGPKATKSHTTYISTEAAFTCQVPTKLPQRPEPIHVLLFKQLNMLKTTQAQSPLTAICANLKHQARSKYENKYVEDLTASLHALQMLTSASSAVQVDESVVVSLKRYSTACRQYFEDMTLTLQTTAQGFHHSSQPPVADSGSKWMASPPFRCMHRFRAPRFCPTFFLQQLNRDKWKTLSKEWREVLVIYACAVTELQRAQRLLALSNNPVELAQELSNQGHKNWDPLEYPESLLLEAESGILIREVQEEIAAQMRYPPNGDNAVMQLNMGEGKSSVIIPIVAAALADGTQ